MPEERMDVEKQLAALNKALRLQHRSVLQYSLTAGTVVGLEFQAHSDKLRAFALAELEDARAAHGEDHGHRRRAARRSSPSSSSTPTRPRRWMR